MEQVRWDTLSDMLRHPAYAGAYVSAGATTMVVSGCQASRTVGDASCAIRSAGRCCIAGLCRLT